MDLQKFAFIQKMKEAFGWHEFSLTEMCTPFPGLGHKCKWFWGTIMALYWPASMEKNYIYFHILGGVVIICLMILKHKFLVCPKKTVAMMFSFFRLAIWIFQLLSHNYPFRKNFIQYVSEVFQSIELKKPTNSDTFIFIQL